MDLNFPHIFFCIFSFPKILSYALATSDGNFYLDVNSTFIKHLDTVRVSFSGLKPNDESAWLGVFSPSSAHLDAITPLTCSYCNPPWTTNAPMKWIMCQNITGCMENGEGAFDFILENTFEDVKIAMFTGGIDSPLLLVESQPISFRDINAPLRGHLTRTQSESEMMVVWASRELNKGAGVCWGSKAGGPYEFTAAVKQSRTYTQSELCGPPANS